MEVSTEHRAPLIEHIRELRARVFWCLLFVAVGAIGGYFLHDRLLEIIQKPINQTLYYTAPTGALTFVIKVCIVFGLIVGLPAIMYHIFAFLGPLLSRRSKKGIVFFTVLSMVLAVSGVVFSYFVTLPAALHFLVGFGSKDIKSMITADEYFSFAFAYIVGFAVLFQIPLLLLFINRVHRLPPAKLITSVRYVVIICFVASAIITPTPDPLNQTLMAAPAIGLYLVSSLVVTVINVRYWRRLKRQAQAERRRRERPAVAAPLSSKPGGAPLYPIKREFVKQPPPLQSMVKQVAIPAVTAAKPLAKPKPVVAVAPARPRPIAPASMPSQSHQLAARMRQRRTHVDSMSFSRSSRYIAARQRPARPVRRPSQSYNLPITPRKTVIERRAGFISDFVGN